MTEFFGTLATLLSGSLQCLPWAQSIRGSSARPSSLSNRFSRVAVGFVRSAIPRGIIDLTAPTAFWLTPYGRIRPLAALEGDLAAVLGRVDFFRQIMVPSIAW